MMLREQQKVNLKVILVERLKTSYSEIAEFCQRWNISELALFGSVLQEDFYPNSDVDILVVYEPYCQLTLSKLLHMQEELETKFGSAVDLVEKAMIKNPYRLSNILKTYQVIYAKQ